MTAHLEQFDALKTSDEACPHAERSTAAVAVCVLWVGLSLSIGWGIRGNFGHEYGAMIPGALAGLAAALLSGRGDWHRRSVFFAFFGAIGWSFGGSISYMQVIAYTHSGHTGSVLYGFACLFMIGFLWAAIGGAGTALPAFLNRERLTEFLPALGAVFIGWAIQELCVAAWFPENPEFRQRSPLYWYDTSWLAALVAIVAVLGWVLARRRLDSASSLILHMSIGWWAGFLLLVNLLGWRMTPPRGDNWAGCVGMVAGMWIYFQRHGLAGLTFVSLISGFFGGFGFAFATLLKLIGMSSGWETNWHSILEQTYGFMNGIGLGLALFWAARHVPHASEEPPVRRWAEPFAAGFVLLVVTYLNLSKNPEEWVHAKAMPAVLYRLSPDAWFGFAYGTLSLVFVTLLMAHRREPLALLSISWLARGQLLYLVFLWLMVVGNFERALVAFTAQRLITEGVIFLNAALCTVGLFLSVPAEVRPLPQTTPPWRQLLPKAIAIGVLVMALSVLAEWAVVRLTYGDRQAGLGARHIRFGPEATATKAKPPPDVPHP